MEPLHSYQGEDYEEEHTKPHIVYKKSAPKQDLTEDSSACDTSGTKHTMVSHLCPFKLIHINTTLVRAHQQSKSEISLVFN